MISLYLLCFRKKRKEIKETLDRECQMRDAAFDGDLATLNHLFSNFQVWLQNQAYRSLCMQDVPQHFVFVLFSDWLIHFLAFLITIILTIFSEYHN